MSLRKIFPLVVLLGWSLAASADTITVSGNVSGTWSADTVMVVGEVIVPAGESLTIDPGVQVRFTGRYKFIVNGLLTAEGTCVDSIIFTRHEPTEESKWRGFRFDGADDASNLKYCRIEYAKGDGAYPEVRGGAVWISECSPTVSHCLIAYSYTHNSNYNGCGGGVCIEGDSYSIIEYNRITQNEADSGGGILVGQFNNPLIRYNIIEDNTAFYSGGGIYVSAAGSSTIMGNIIRGNTAGGYGGGGITLWSATWLYGSYSLVYDNLITGNSASDAGGGIYSRYEQSYIYQNTIVDNSANRGGGIYVLTFSDLPPFVFSSIVRENSAGTGSQVYLDPVAGSTINVNYSNVEGGWSGTGNIDMDPMYVEETRGDYRLQWESPCIDSGDPSGQYNNPDGTRADMGAYFFDQSAPVRVLLTPHDAPIEISAAGGVFNYTIRATNIEGSTQSPTVWVEVIMPDQSVIGPLVGPVTAPMGANLTLDRERNQTVPGAAPAGPYEYVAYAVVGADTSQDSFTFVKSAGADEGGLTGWFSGGEPLTGLVDPTWGVLPVETVLLGNYPNPFNPSTVISYRLQDAGFMNLSVYDISGRKVAELVNGWRDAGVHEVTFDGTGLASGMYFYRLEAGDFSAQGKMVLIK